MMTTAQTLALLFGVSVIWAVAVWVARRLGQLEARKWGGKLTDESKERKALQVERNELAEDNAELRGSIAKLESVTVGLQELAQCAVRLDTGRFLSNTVGARAGLQKLEDASEDFEGEEFEEFLGRVGVVCDSLDSARKTMADVRELLGDVAGRIVKGAEHA